jgi:hypothetical protein
LQNLNDERRNECPAADRRKGGFQLLILADESGNLL